jgi:hypothetical protein
MKCEPKNLLPILLYEVSTDHLLVDEVLISVSTYQVWCLNTSQVFGEPKDPDNVGPFILDLEKTL